MYRGHSIGVVIPTYNEERFVGDVIRTLPEYVDRTYVVDDASTDDSWNVMRRYAETVVDGRTEGTLRTDGVGSVTTQNDRSENHVVAIRHERNRGVGGAIKTGYQYAYADGIDITAVFGGDGQMDPDQLERLLDPIVDDRADYAKGNRLLYRDHSEQMPRFRFVGNTLLSVLTKFASGYWKTMDPQNGYTAISWRALDEADVDGMYEYFGYCNDLLVRLNVVGMRVADVSIPAIYGDEKSHIRYLPYIRRVSGMLFRSFLWRLKVKYLKRDFNPLALFYVVGGLTTALGTGSTLAAARGLRDERQASTTRLLASVLLAVTGVLSVLLGAWFDMTANESLEIQIGVDPPGGGGEPAERDRVERATNERGPSND